uniref:Uncharacterized protein n=2 Tax=Avena sativa TaxID=4498 RepID=A0ACD5X0G3_AVESA
MGRRGSGGGSRSAPRVKTPAPKPATKSSAPAPAVSGGAPTSIIGSLGSAIADGIGWGVGTSMAHRAIDSILGPRTIRVVEGTESAPAASPASAPLDACSIHNKAFGDCINQNGSDISRCQFYLDLLNECRRNGGVSTIA